MALQWISGYFRVREDEEADLPNEGSIMTQLQNHFDLGLGRAHRVRWKSSLG